MSPLQECETMGFRSGIDIEALAAERAIPRMAMPDEPLYGAVARAGLPAAASCRR